MLSIRIKLAVAAMAAITFAGTLKAEDDQAEEVYASECIQEISKAGKAKTPKLIKCINETLLEIKSQTISDAEGSIISLSAKSGVSEYVEDSGDVVGRKLIFKKIQEKSIMRFTYSDNFRTKIQGKSCRWVLEIDGEPCPSDPIHSDFYNGTPGSIHFTSTMISYCKGVSAGEYTLNVKLEATPHANNGYAGGDCHTGWHQHNWLLEAMELRPGSHSHFEE